MLASMDQTRGPNQVRTLSVSQSVENVQKRSLKQYLASKPQNITLEARNKFEVPWRPLAENRRTVSVIIVLVPTVPRLCDSFASFFPS